jgi:site-specific DNA recombinase
MNWHHTMQMMIRARDVQRSRGSSAPDPVLVDLALRSHRCLQQLTDGTNRSLADIASANHVDPPEVSRNLALAFLSPELADTLLASDDPMQLTAHQLSRSPDLAVSWACQHALLTAQPPRLRSPQAVMHRPSSSASCA